MKTYIVYNEKGEEIALLKASNHNSAETKAKKKYGEKTSVCYTEI